MRLHPFAIAALLVSAFHHQPAHRADVPELPVTESFERKHQGQHGRGHNNPRHHLGPARKQARWRMAKVSRAVNLRRR